MTVPAPVLGKLEFGNPAQIQALRRYESAVTEEENTREYEVELRVCCTGYIRRRVRAHDADEAKEIAKEAGWDSDDFDDTEFDVESVKEV